MPAAEWAYAVNATNFSVGVVGMSTAGKHEARILWGTLARADKKRRRSHPIFGSGGKNLS